jgi:hypothetical protein
MDRYALESLWWFMPYLSVVLPARNRERRRIGGKEPEGGLDNDGV